MRPAVKALIAAGSTVEMFDVRRGRWTMLPSMSVSRNGHVPPPPCPPPRIPFDWQNARLDVLSWSKSSGQSQLVKFNWSKPTGQSRLIKAYWSELACALSALSIRAARGLRRCLNGALAAARAGPRIRPVLAEASPIRTPLVGGSLAASLTGPRPEATRRSRGEGTCAHPCTHRVH